MLNARHSLEGQGQEESWSVLASWSKQVINLQAYLEVQSQKIRLGMTEEDIQYLFLTSTFHIYMETVIRIYNVLKSIYF